MAVKHLNLKGKTLLVIENKFCFQFNGPCGVVPSACFLNLLRDIIKNTYMAPLREVHNPYKADPKQHMQRFKFL